MNYGRAFSFVTEDPDWIKKVLIAAVALIVPVVGILALLGWGLEINRRISSGESEILPEWSDFGALILSGLKYFVVILVYFLPVILFYSCAIVTVVAGASLTSSGDASNAEMMTNVILGVSSCMYCFVFVFALLGGLLLAPASSVLAETGQIGAALRVGHIFGLLRAAMGPYIISILIIGLASSVASSIGSIACGVGAFVASAYMLCVTAHLHGQAYKIAKSITSA